MTDASLFKVYIFQEFVLAFSKVRIFKSGFPVFHMFVLAPSHSMTFSCDSRFKQ